MKALLNFDEWLIEEEEKWIQKAIKHPGAFKEKAQQHNMTTRQFVKHVEDHPDDFDEQTKKQANLAKNLMKMH